MKIRYYVSMALLAALASCGNKQSETTVAPVNVAVETAGGVSASISDKNYVGEIEPATSTAVSSLTPGRIISMNVQEGKNVSAGQVIATLDATQARNALSAAKAVLKQAEDAYSRMKILHEKRAIAEMDWVSVQSKLQQAQATVQTCQKAVSDCTVKAPCSGVVGKKEVEPGMTVLPGQPLCTVIDINKVKVKISVPELERNLFSANTKTTITVKALNQTFNGGSVETGIEGNSISRTYEVLININNSSHKLMPGMVCDVKVDGSQIKAVEPNTISLPITAVHRRASGEMFVWKVVNGEAKRCTVKTGITSGDRIEIQEGVTKGDKIITDGYQKVSDGSKVNITK